VKLVLGDIGKIHRRDQNAFHHRPLLWFARLSRVAEPAANWTLSRGAAIVRA
jgi:hypothetical protein